MKEATGLEPAVSYVTGRRETQSNRPASGGNYEIGHYRAFPNPPQNGTSAESLQTLKYHVE